MRRPAALIPRAVPAPSGVFQSPIKNPILLSPYGWRRHRFHSGVDIRFERRVGAPIQASRAGKVIKAGWRGGYGNMILLRHDDGYCTRYAHLHRFNVSLGQRVKAGELIGAMGATGHATGPHLHFEILTPNMDPIDPAPFLSLNS